MILVFGTICLDRVRKVPYLPQPGGYVEITEEDLWLGGEAANTAFVLQSWGAEVELFGNPFGGGEDGRRLLRLIDERGLRHKLRSPALGGDLQRAPVCDVYVTPDGERTMFGQGFSNVAGTIDLSDLPLKSGEWFTAEPNLRPIAEEAIRRAQTSGMKCYLMDFFQEGDPITEKTYWQSSTDWVGTRGNTQENVRWVQEWVARWGCFTILSDGPNGIVAGGPELTVRHYPPYPTPRVVDSTGAGDVFRAAMLYGLNCGKPISECLQFASAAGCLSTQGLGATGHVPTLAEISDHVDRHSEVSRQYL